MQIPPVPPTSFQYAPANQPDPVQQFSTDWNAWKASPKQETSQTLLTFMVQNQTALSAIGDARPCPFLQKESFSQCYLKALDKLSNFVHQGCPQSSFQDTRKAIGDIDNWLTPPVPFLQQFYNDWTAWYDSPTKETADTLLSFLTDNKAQIFAMGDKLPCPMPPPYKLTFEQCYNDAVNTLSDWINNKNDPCDPKKTAMVSEFIADLYDWLHQ